MAIAQPSSFLKDSVREQASLQKTQVSDGLSIQLQSAPFFRRAVAYAIDLGLCTVPVYIIGIALIFFSVFVLSLMKTSKANAIQSGLGAGFILVFFLVVVLVILSIYHFYFVYYEYKKGATIGKRLMGLKVVSLDGRRLSLKQCILRDVARYIDCTLLFPGLLSISLTKHRQRLGDLMANTLVTFSPHEEKSFTYLYLSQNTFLYLLNIVSGVELTIDIEEDFLRFAFSRFINRRETEQLIRDQGQWVAFFRSRIGTNAFPDVQDDTLLRFFAERIHQERLGAKIK